MRARSESFRFSTDLVLSSYFPSEGESSRPRIDSSVDFPHPDGPAIDTYSPRLMSMLMFSSACVSTSSVRNTFETPSRWINGVVSSVISSPLSASSTRVVPGQPLGNKVRCASFQFDALGVVVLGHVGKNHLVPRLEPFDDLDGVHGGAAQLDLNARGHLVVRLEPKERDGAEGLPLNGPADVDDIGQFFQLDRAVDAQVRHRPL